MECWAACTLCNARFILPWIVPDRILRMSSLAFTIARGSYAISMAETLCLRTFGGTPNRDPCSSWGLIWEHPRDIRVI